MVSDPIVEDIRSDFHNFNFISTFPFLSAKYLVHLVSLMSPVYWTTATEVGEAANGFSLTNGHFRREVQAEFATG